MKKIIPYLLFVSSSSFSQIVTPSYANVSYVADTLTHHKLDVFIPAGTSAPSPCVVHIHGGGFGAGQKGEALPSPFYPSGTTFCDSLYYNGYVIADINYRLSSDTAFPGAVYDCKTAIRFLKEHADIYFIDTCRMGVIGESAGGYFVAMLGTSADVSSLEGLHLGSTHATSHVQSVLDMYGVTDFNYFDGYYPNVPPDSCSPYPPNQNNNPNSWVGKFLGCSINACPDIVAQASTIDYVDGNEPAFSIWHGTKDCTVPPIQSTLLYDSLIAQGGDAVIHYVLHGTHSDVSFFTDTFRRDVREFFDDKIKFGNPGCLPTSVTKRDEYARVLVFPNPSSGQFTVLITNLSTSTKLVSLQLENALGAIIFSSEEKGFIDLFKKIIDIRNIPRGVYSIEIKNGTEFVRKKIILIN